MAVFVYADKASISQDIQVRRLPIASLGTFYSARRSGTLLAAVIKQQDEVDSAWRQQLPEKLVDRDYCTVDLGGIEFIVIESALDICDKVPSGSEDSDSYKVGSNDDLGLLIHYMGSEAWHTNDPVAHTSVHHHEESTETYLLLHGAAAIELRNINNGERRTVKPLELGSHQQIGFVRGVTIPLNWQHPVVSVGKHSIMLISTTPPNNTKSDHHYDGLFKDLFHDVIASYTQRTHGPSATGLIGGSQ